MKNYPLISFLFFIGVAYAQGQENDTPKFPNFADQPSLTIKFAPLNFLERYYHTLEGALEYKFHEKFAAQAQFGYGNSDVTVYQYQDDEVSAFETYRARFEFRFYKEKLSKRLQKRIESIDNQAHRNRLLTRRKSDLPYWAIEFTWRNTTFFSQGFVGQGCSNGLCNAQQLGIIRLRQNLGIFHVKFGRQSFISKKFFVDYYLGFGGRYVDIGTTDESQRLFPRRLFVIFDTREPGNFFAPSLTAGIKLGYFIALK